MFKALKSGIFVLAIVVIASCSGNDVYFEYKSIVGSGWNKDSVVAFDFEIKDIQSSYNVYVNVRNNGEYPYQNLWLFVHKTLPDSLLKKDTINFYLANDRGKWLGSGIGSVFDMPVLYQQNIKFAKAGKYSYKIIQAMRDTVLTGISDVGLRVEKIK
jgi:gliding motility-associated lipoprotein GldH